ncbi:DUF4175 domain-containing protein [Falsirhodobacter sp. 20TX0035]|uniref:DUF4175 domain-containing protein n=1 Tax=Falsirhodobacter sp. 20TX0035 TaxID=3022019 RepID=UPI00232A8BF4|nr:DUF4175 domain-containing protein [Falsirhodobacter sp. 20TX0035]MDB6452447.1 DUF4175 domain-containing protein [Falsirhodobacter sp. 20TX0035]
MSDIDATLRRLRWPIRLTLAGLWAERLSRSFWPLWTIALITFATLAFGVQDRLPLEVVWGWMVVIVVGGLALLVRGLRRFRIPRRAEAVARLDASLPGQPIASLTDTQAVGSTDPASAAVWEAHRRRMAQRAEGARPVAPNPDLARRDPFALRYVALTALVVALLFGSVWRVATVAGLPGGSVAATGPMWEGWIQPPAHTGKPALYLNDLNGPITVPVGSRVLLRLYGGVGDLTVAETVSARTEAATASAPQQEFEIRQSGVLTVSGDGGREWPVTATPDTPPTVSGTGDLTREADGKMRLPFQAADDYGVTGGQAEIALDLPAIERRYGLAAEPEPRDPIRIDLPLPVTGQRTEFSDVLVQDLSQHPFANLPVTIRLSATDAAGQTGTAEPVHTTLPGKRFFDPLAAALVEMRRDLLWSRGNAPRVDQVLRAITHRPEGLFRNDRVFLRLRAVMRDLAAAGTDLSVEMRDRIAEELWAIALLIEEGDANSARERMQRAQDRLSQAMRDGADPAEIESLMQELREATDDYIRELAENARRNPDQQQAQGEGQELTGDQLQQMMDQIQSLMQQGRMAEAQALMDQLRQMMDNLQVTEGEGGQGSGPPSMRQLQDTLRDQQDLSDEGFQGLQEGQPDVQGLADRQRELRERLGQLGELPGEGTEPGQEGQRQIDRAGRAMEEAERALRDGDMSGALDRQAEAMEALRDGMRQMNEALAREQGEPQGGDPSDQQGRNEGEGRDPLGRPPGDSARIGSDRNLLNGEDQARQRAEELLGEIRRRAGEQQRPAEERDYLRRLLDFF